MEKHKKKYKYYSGHHSNIAKINAYVSNQRHASVLDRLAFFSLNSDIGLPNLPNGEGWFCIPYIKIGALTGYRERTIKAIIKSFLELGLIEVTHRLYSNARRACIRISEKTKHILKLSTPSDKKSGESPPVSIKEEDNKESESFFCAHKCTSENAKNALPYIEERKKEKVINIITSPSEEKNVDKPYNLPKSVKKVCESIGERLEEKQKASIWGAIINVKKQTGINISNVSEFYAWIAFSILNAKHHLKGAETFDHKLNFAMKIARSKNGLCKPRGFHNHWDIGQKMKHEKEANEKEWDDIKSKDRKTARNIEYDFPMNDGFHNGVGYIAAKTANELWEGHATLKKEKSLAATIRHEISACINDNKALEKLFSKNIDEKVKRQKLNNARIDALKKELEETEQAIAKLEGEASYAKDVEWQPLYTNAS